MFYIKYLSNIVLYKVCNNNGLISFTQTQFFSLTQYENRLTTFTLALLQNVIYFHECKINICEKRDLSHILLIIIRFSECSRNSLY